jgi:glycosyltransferase involved in cell wall biosynthesis
MKRLLRAHPAVHIVVFSGSASFGMPAVPPGGPRRALVTDHFNFLSKALPAYSIEIPEKRAHPSWEGIERQAANSYDHVFVLGCHVREAALSRWSLDPKRITAIGAGPNHGIDIVRDRASKCFSSRRVLFVGRDAARKGLADAVAAFSRVRARFPEATLHVAGGAVVEQPGVVVHGDLSGDDLRQLFYDSQILVLTSYREPFGIALLEGMWSKCVCIGSTTGAMPEIIQDGVSGFLVEPGDVETMAARLELLLSEPLRLRQMAEDAYRSAASRWHWDRVVQRMLSKLRAD